MFKPLHVDVIAYCLIGHLIVISRIVLLRRLKSLGDAEHAGVEIAGVDNAAPDCRSGKRGRGNRRSLKTMESEDFKHVF